MAFIIESIPEVENKNLSKLIKGYNSALSSRWVIDRDRDCFVVIKDKLGGAYEGTQATEYYVMKFRESFIQIVAEPLAPTFSEEGAVMNWRIIDLSIPPEISSYKNDAIFLLKEAFSSVGQSFDGDRFISTNVMIDPGLISR